MSDDTMPPWRHIEQAELLLNPRNNQTRMNDLGPPSRENQALEALAHATLAIAKMIGSQRA